MSLSYEFVRLLDLNRFMFNYVETKDIIINTKIDNNQDLDLHIGDFKWSARNNDYRSWLVCDGRSLDRELYADLFAVIGTSFGSLNGATFQLPDCRGRTNAAIGKSRNLTFRVLGETQGAETHALSINELPAHNHTINDPGHTHTQHTINDDFNLSGGNPPGFAGDSSGHKTWNNIDAAATGITINNTGNNLPFNIMQPTLFIGNIFIYSGVNYTSTNNTIFDLNKLNTWIIDNSNNFLSYIPDWYNYTYDGTFYNNVNVMVDIANSDNLYNGGGNFIWLEGNVFDQTLLPNRPVNRHNANTDVSDNAFPYGQVYYTPDSNAGVLVSGQSYPHLTLAYVTNGNLNIRVFGDTGSGGEATVTNYTGSYSCMNGLNGSYWANINWDTNNPTIGDVWFTITYPMWGTYICNVNDQRKTSDTGNYNHYVGITGHDYFFGKILLSTVNGQYIEPSNVEEFLSNYVNQLPIPVPQG
jgi:microcystin-dependent protein